MVSDLVTASIVMLIIGVGAFILGITQWRIKRLIENTPTSAIRGIAMGFVEIQGKVSKQIDKSLTAPLTNTPCAYYTVKVEELRSRGKKGSEWVTILSRKDWTLFHAEDSTGKVLVDPKDANVDIPRDYTFQTGTFQKTSPTIQEFCKKEGLAISGMLGFQRSLRFEESRLEPGDMVFILGTAGDNPHKEEATAQQSVDDIMIQQKKGMPYYISDTTEKNVLRKYAFTVYGGLLGGGALILGGLALLFSEMGVLL